MFILHASNKTENLLAHLARVIETSPLSSPFCRETFLIQSQGMERWLSQQLATHFKVWGNYEYLFPGKFFSSLAQQVFGEFNDEVFDRDMMLWHFESLLRELDSDVYAPLQQYLAGDNIALKRYQLARQLAQIFDQYQIMRPDMLEQWQQGREVLNTDTESWQRHLWKRVIVRLGSRHRGALWMEAIEKLQTAPEGSLTERLPERVNVFGLNSMPPIFLDFLQGLSHHTQVHLFLLNPCQIYWADLKNKRQLARQNPDDSELQKFAGHPLLANLGQQGREFQQMLLDQADFELQIDSFEPAEDNQRSNLQHLQNDLLTNQLQEKPLQDDGSIRIHACHSRMREVQVLKNQLLQVMESNLDIELREIVVMAPDIQQYEPFISAVFEDIQFAIADRSLRTSNAVLDAFIRFLRLSQSRFGWQSVLDLLEQPSVYPGFNLSESDLELIRNWIHNTNIRWGRSAEHKKELGLPPLQENTWQAGLDRLMMGYAFEDDRDFVNGVLPYCEIEGSSAQALGGLSDFIQLLFEAGKQLSQAKPLKAWAAELFHYSELLLSAKTTEPSQVQELNGLIAELENELPSIHSDDIELDVLIAWLEDSVQERKSSSGFLRGQLTFCSMLPMRSIPFKVIALLGMNEGEFPKIDRHSAFDLLGQNFRQGDRSRRADDRYQFLEILLSARKQLIMTYIGQSLRQNEPIQPSVVVSELLDLLEEQYQLTELVVQHPLQSFSWRYFEGVENLFSYSQADCQTAIALNSEHTEPTVWWSGEIAAEDSEVIEIGDLLNFFRQPQRFFVQRRLSLRLGGIEAETEEREPFSINGLNAYQINHDWISAELSQKEWSLPRLQAQGRWLSGVCGDIEYEEQRKSIEDFSALIMEKNTGDSCEDLAIDIEIEGYRLVGKLANLYQNGSLFFRYANIKGKDFIPAWLHHLIINRVQQQKTWLIGTDENLLFEPEYCQPGDLKKWIEIYREGQKHPAAFFVEPALAYTVQAYKIEYESARKSAIDSAAAALYKAIDSSYESELSLLFGDWEDPSILLDNQFEQYCQTLLQPVWETVHGH